MIFLIGAILVIATVIFIGYPLFKRNTARERQNDAYQELMAKRAALHSLIDELALDFKMGNISEKEHRELENK